VNNKEMKNLIKRARKFAKPFRVTADGFRLQDIGPAGALEPHLGSACAAPRWRAPA
jgi:hypothetical protein